MHRIVFLALLAAPIFAQLAAPNDAGISIGHIHLMVADPEAHRKFWVDMLGGQAVKLGSLEMYKLPGVYIIAGKARPSFIVSHRVGLDEAPEAYRRFDQRRDGYTKVILKPRNGSGARA